MFLKGHKFIIFYYIIFIIIIYLLGYIQTHTKKCDPYTREKEEQQ